MRIFHTHNIYKPHTAGSDAVTTVLLTNRRGDCISIVAAEKNHWALERCREIERTMKVTLERATHEHKTSK